MNEEKDRKEGVRNMIWQVERIRARAGYLDDDGAEKISSKSLVVEIGRGARSLSERIREAIQAERMRLALEERGYESIEDADDFDLPDEDGEEPWSAYELEDDFGEPLVTQKDMDEALTDGVPSSNNDTSPPDAPPMPPSEGSSESEEGAGSKGQ